MARHCAPRYSNSFTTAFRRSDSTRDRKDRVLRAVIALFTVDKWWARIQDVGDVGGRIPVPENEPRPSDVTDSRARRSSNVSLSTAPIGLHIADSCHM